MRQPHPSFEIRAVNYQLPANESKPARFPQNPITEYLVMGETLGYKVDRISVILPDDTSKLKIVPGEDRVTLMTCTPYGVNTHRLLISGHRVAIPMPAPEPNDVLDARNVALGVGLGILAAGLFIIWLARRHKAARIIRHGAFWPWMRRKGESANDTLA